MALTEEQSSKDGYDWEYIGQSMKPNEAMKKATVNQQRRDLTFRVGDDITDYIHSLRRFSKTLQRSDDDVLDKVEQGIPHYLPYVFNARREGKSLLVILDILHSMHGKHAANCKTSASTCPNSSQRPANKFSSNNPRTI